MDTETPLNLERIRSALSADGRDFLTRFAGHAEPLLPHGLARRLGGDSSQEMRRMFHGFREAKDQGLVKLGTGNAVVFTELGEEVSTLPPPGRSE